MKVASSAVCRMCKLFDSENKCCSLGETIGAPTKDDCWNFSDKSKTLNLAEHSQDGQDWRL